MNDPEDIKPEEEDEEEKPFVDEETSYSFLFFATSGALLFVTLWGFWDDEFSRRGFKQYQNSYFKAQYARAEVKWKAADQAVAAKEQAIKDSLVLVDRELDGSDDYQILVDQVEEAEIKLAEVKEKKKFARQFLTRWCGSISNGDGELFESEWGLKKAAVADAASAAVADDEGVADAEEAEVSGHGIPTGEFIM